MENLFNLKLPSGEIIDGFTRREVLGLIGINDEYNNSLVQSESEWIPIIEWANKNYQEMFEKNHFHFIGEPLVWWESIMALAFLYPKRWRLLSFELNDDNFILKFGDGSVAEFSKDSFKAEINIDKQYRRKIDIKVNEKKYGFFESLIGYADTDFDLMVYLLEAKPSKLMKFTVTLDNFNRQLRKTIARH